MTHVHEYRLVIRGDQVIIAMCTDGLCDEWLSGMDILRRLAATERLSASLADTAASLIRGHTVKHDLKAYAAALEGGLED